MHIASSSSQFKDRIFEAGTTFGAETDGTWLLAPSKSSSLPDLVYIKTSNTGSGGKVEVHVASGASQYKTRTLETATVFSNENNGVWKYYDYDGDGTMDLVYIKTNYTGTPNVEVHVASGSSNFARFILQTPTTFALEGNGQWSLAPYTSRNAADLVYIKTANTGTGKVEVHIASSSSGFKTRVYEAGTGFDTESNGVWSLIDYNRDGTLDLAYVKYQNTGSGTVEVHVASGN